MSAASFDAGWNVIDFRWWMPVWLHHLYPKLPGDFPMPSDYWISIPLAIVITLIRLYVSDPIATRIAVTRLGLSRTSLRHRNNQEQDPQKRIPKWVLDEIDGFAQDNILMKKKLKKKKKTALEIRFEKQQRWKQFSTRVIASAAGGSKEGGAVTQAQLNQWWAVIKSDSARTLELMKFNEAFWRMSFYAFIWAYGIYVGCFNGEAWLTDIRAIWGGWPLEQHPSIEVRWYYFLSMGHYLHLFVTQFFEPKRKDWWEMFIHHIVTMLLLFFSYIVNFLRIGVVVLLCHDGSDVFLELAKLFNYMKMGAATDVTFTIFALAFFIGRLVMYPWRVVYVAVVIGAEQVGIWRGFYIFVGLLLVLQVLHFFWFYTIACMVYSFAVKGNVEKDVREETESEPEETTQATSPATQRRLLHEAGLESASTPVSPQKASATPLLDADAVTDADTADADSADADGATLKQRTRTRRSRAPDATAEARVTRSRSQVHETR